MYRPCSTLPMNIFKLRSSFSSNMVCIGMLATLNSNKDFPVFSLSSFKAIPKSLYYFMSSKIRDTYSSLSKQFLRLCLSLGFILYFVVTWWYVKSVFIHGSLYMYIEKYLYWKRLDKERNYSNKYTNFVCLFNVFIHRYDLLLSLLGR